MNKHYFITGTDTNIGKTWATAAMMHKLRQLGKTVVGMKPVASGCTLQAGQWRNDDALMLQANASAPVAYPLINPYAYEEAVSPHLAGRHDPLSMDKVRACYAQLQTKAEWVLVEGAGGWLSPVNADADNGDLAKALGLPVILVVGIRLGCINHAKLTAQAIAAKGLPCAGWLANRLDRDMPYQQENIATLQAALAAPLLGVLPYQEALDLAALSSNLNLANLLGSSG